MKVLPVTKPIGYFDNPTKLAARKSETEKYAAIEGAKYVFPGKCFVYDKRGKVRELCSRSANTVILRCL